jgi:hypothetical protein
MSTTKQQKEALYAATCPDTVNPDVPWEQGGMERMSFEHPEHRRILGTVEIDSSEVELKDVRLELVVPPEVAVKVIALLMAEPAETIEAVPSENHTAEVTMPFLPPTKDPTADDLEEMAAEESEEAAALPVPVDNIIALGHVL